MPKLLLTDVSIRAISPGTNPGTERVDYWDTKMPGFGLRVGPRTKIFIAKFKNRRYTIGPYPEITLAAARSAARRLAYTPPAPRSTLTFAEAHDVFLATHCASKREGTRREYAGILKRHFLTPLGRKNLAEVTTQELIHIVDKLGATPAEAHHAFAVVRTLFGWAHSRRYIAANPLSGVRAPKKNAPRSRVLAAEELKRVWDAAVEIGYPFGVIVQLLILTGQRVSQIADLHAAWIDREARTMTFPPAIMKGNREHQLPYGPMAATIVDALPRAGRLFPARGTQGENPFNGWSKSKRKLDQRSGAAGWTLHDLRRTLRTNLAALRIPREHGERILDHRSAAATDVEAIYDRYLYVDEMREALERWEQRLQRILGQDGTSMGADRDRVEAR